MSYRQRWQSEDGRRLAAKVFDRLRRGRSLDGLGLGTVDGRIDLRGLVLPEEVSGTPVKAAGVAVDIADGKLPEIRKARLRSLDLSESRLRHLRMFRVLWEDCDLRGADLTDFHAWRSEFSGCDFSGADLTNAMLSSAERGEDNLWRDCRLDALVLDGVIAKGGEFRRCSFEHVKWRNMVFSGCRFVDCRVTGSLENVMFYGRAEMGGKPVTMTNFDLHDCRFTEVGFVGLQLSGVRLPHRDSVVILPRARRVLEALRSAVAGRSGEEAYAISTIIKYTINHVGPEDDFYVDYDSIRQIGGEPAVALLRELLTEVS